MILADETTIREILDERFGAGAFSIKPLVETAKGPSDQLCVWTAPNRLIELMTFLEEDPRTRFEMCADVTCVDYLYYPNARDRYGVTYCLVSISLGRRLWVKCMVNDPAPEVPSVTGLWKGADWLEREVYDLFGIRFTGHPDLRRIMTWDGFTAHPLRKEYPVTGLGEREQYPVVTRETA